MLVLESEEILNWRLVLATLSGTPVKIAKIRPNDGGLKDFEVTFLRILDTITNGSVLEISQTGTSIVYKPGLVIGGAHQFNCPTSKAVGYFIEPLLLLAPFSKQPVSLTFNGITNSSKSVGIDIIRTTFFPLLLKFGLTDCELKINKRGSEPQGGGQVVLRMNNQLLQPKTLHATEPFSINKIRGVAYSTRVSPTSVNRMIDAARQKLKLTGVDTFIYSDVTRGQDSGASPGFGITLVAETKSGLPIAVEDVAIEGSVPEDIGSAAADKLLLEIAKRGSIASADLKLAAVLMTLGSEDVGRLLLGPKQIHNEFILLLRDIAKFWPGAHAVFKEQFDNNGNVLMLMKGTGFVNANKKIA